MRRVAVVTSAAAVAAGLAPGARAHGFVRPTVATPGAVQQLTFDVLNGQDTGIVAFRLQLPAGATVEQVTARQPTWTATSTDTTIEWRGGPIPARTSDSFRARVRMPDSEGTASFLGTEVFESGAGPPSRFDVVLAGNAAAAAETTDEGARTIAKAALLVAIVALVLAAASLALAVVRRRR